MLVSLRSKVSILLIAGILFITLLLVAAIIDEVKKRYIEVYLKQAEIVSEQLAFSAEQLLQLGLYPNELQGFEKLCAAAVSKNNGIEYVALQDQIGNVLYQSDTFEKNLPAYKSTQLPTNKVINLDDLSIIYPVRKFDGIPLSFIYAKVGEKAILDEVTAVTNTILLYSFIAIVVGIGIIIIFAEVNITQPVSQLVSHIKEMNPKNIPVTDKKLNNRRDELGLISRVFDDLMGVLAKKNKEIIETNEDLRFLADNLESMVEIRTNELLIANKKLDQLAHTDHLTGLPNRLHFNKVLAQRFEHALRHKRAFAILHLDLDGFKEINDRYGHAAGDIALEVVSHRIKDSFRGGDIFFRVGGDEFVFIAEDFDGKSNLLSIVEKLQNRIKEPFLVDREQLSVGVSIGIACLPKNYNGNSDDLLKYADTAMYEAKSGREGYKFWNNGVENHCR